MESTYVVAKSCINNAGQSGTAAVRHWSRVCGLHLSVQLDNLLRRGIGNPELCMIKQQRVCTETSSCNTSCTRCKNGTTQACWILLA